MQNSQSNYLPADKIGAKLPLSTDRHISLKLAPKPNRGERDAILGAVNHYSFLCIGSDFHVLTDPTQLPCNRVSGLNTQEMGRALLYQPAQSTRKGVLEAGS